MITIKKWVKFSPGLKVYFYIFFSFYFLIFFSLTYNPFATPLENGVYASYTESLINDGDLNIHNNVTGKGMSWLATKTFNNPDMHDHGIALMWSPFFLYNKLLNSFGVDLQFQNSKARDVAQSFATVFLAIVGIIFCRNLIMSFTSKPTHLTKVFYLFILGTPFAWCTIFLPRNSDISTFCFAGFWLICSDFFLRRSKRLEWFLVGALLGIGHAIKVTMPFYLFVIFYYAFVHLKSIEFKKKIYLLTFFGLGVLTTLFLFFINQYLKFGEIPLLGTYSETFIFSRNIFKEIFFGTNGYFYICPFLFLIVGVYVYYLALLVRKIRLDDAEKFALIAFLGVLSKLLIESFALYESTDFGPRHYIIDFPIMALMMHSFYGRLENFTALKRRLVKAIIYASVGWSVLMYFWINVVFDRLPWRWGAYYINEIGFLGPSTISLFKRFALTVLLYPYYIYKSIPYVALVLLCAYLISKLIKIEKWGKKALTIGLSYFLISYLMLTILNVKNNQKNVAKMKANGEYRETVIAKGFDLYLYDEIISSLGRVLVYSKFKKDEQRYRVNKEVLRKYLDKIQSQVLIDPINFKIDLENYKWRASHHELWNRPDDYTEFN